jgi:hypothetical protein
VIKEGVLIRWSGKAGFGELTFTYETGKNHDLFLVDTECMGFTHIVEVLKALKS